MNEPEQLFSASLAKDAVYKPGLRNPGLRRRERAFEAGDCVLQPAGIVHNELDCSDDLEVLEIYSPAVHPTVVVDALPAVAAATAAR
jgi:uncharacterized protein YjlB